MKLEIKKGPFTWSVLNESGSVVAKISSLKLIGAEKKITDIDGHILYTTDKIENTEEGNPLITYVSYKDDKPFAKADLEFEPGDKETTLFYLPKAIKMKINFSFGEFTVNRNKDNILTVVQDDTEIGQISSLFSLNPLHGISIDHNGMYSPEIWAVVFVLCEYMMHEDDLFIV